MESEGAGTFYFHVEKVTAMAFGTVEDDDLIRTGPSHHAGGVLPAGPFDEDLNLAPDTSLVFASADLVHLRKQTAVPFFFHFLGHLIGHRGGRGVAPGGVFEHESVFEFHLADQRKSVLKISLRFAGKADNEIRGDPNLRLHLAKFFNDGKKAF